MLYEVCRREVETTNGMDPTALPGTPIHGVHDAQSHIEAAQKAIEEQTEFARSFLRDEETGRWHLSVRFAKNQPTGVVIESAPWHNIDVEHVSEFRAKPVYKR